MWYGNTIYSLKYHCYFLRIAEVDNLRNLQFDIICKYHFYTKKKFQYIVVCQKYDMRYGRTILLVY